jgi:hypothetical protein
MRYQTKRAPLTKIFPLCPSWTTSSFFRWAHPDLVSIIPLLDVGISKDLRGIDLIFGQVLKRLRAAKLQCLYACKS